MAGLSKKIKRKIKRRQVIAPRPKQDKWAAQRQRIYKRDKGVCRRCGVRLTIKQAQIDHIVPLAAGKKLGGCNRDSNLRVLCFACHAFRADSYHSGLRAEMQRKGILPSNWRSLLWRG